ncbi:MAG: ScyD/ScyE family protein [Dyadobacter sp.]|uniref:ScyD/ScyE family protein n=1 Tax=Dyadobacter sp. TaxID=1914288 RepID=UPI003267D5E2
MKKFIYSLPTLLTFLFFVLACTDHDSFVPEPEFLSSEPFVSGLKSPVGIALDDKGNIWVTEAGTGSNNDDASIAMITPSGTKTIFVAGLRSITNQGSTEGIGHLLYRDGKLYFLHGVNGMLYVADVSSFKAGDKPVNIADIPSQDVATYIKSLALAKPVNSNAFDLVFGPDDHLFIVDAGSNAIFKRDKKTGEISLFTHFPEASAGVDAVPTGIVYDGAKFFVTTLTGFPFTPGDAKIYTVDQAGAYSEYKKGFTTLSGIVLSANNKPLVLQHGIFGKGFEAKSGKVLDEKGNTIFNSISQPTDIVRAADKMYYLLSYKDGTIVKLSY